MHFQFKLEYYLRHFHPWGPSKKFPSTFGAVGPSEPTPGVLPMCLNGPASNDRLSLGVQNILKLVIQPEIIFQIKKQICYPYGQQIFVWVCLLDQVSIACLATLANCEHTVHHLETNVQSTKFFNLLLQCCLHSKCLILYQQGKRKAPAAKAVHNEDLDSDSDVIRCLLN